MSELDFLGRMATASRQRVDRAKTAVPEAELHRRALQTPPAPILSHDLGGFDVIAEIKLRSPADGTLDIAGDGGGSELADDVAGGTEEDTATDTGARIRARASSYQRAGAAAISVLTEPSEFRGSLEHLAAAAAAVDVPVMRKDFLVDPYQVWEARIQGAGGVLLIVRMLDNGRLNDMVAAARDVGMFVLVEAFDGPDLHRAARLLAGLSSHEKLPPVLVGLNCRDLTTLAVQPERFRDLRGAFPHGVAAVAESGLHTPEDAGRAAALGYDMALVGSALMRAHDPADLLGRFIESGRRARSDIQPSDACESA